VKRFSYDQGHHLKSLWRLVIGTTQSNPLRIAVAAEGEEVALASSAPLWRIYNSNSLNAFSTAYRLNSGVLSPDAFCKMSVNLALSIIDDGVMYELRKLVDSHDKDGGCPHARGTLVLLEYIKKWWNAVADTHPLTLDSWKRKKVVMAEARSDWERMFRLRDLHVDQHHRETQKANADGTPKPDWPPRPRYPSSNLRREMTDSSEALEKTMNSHLCAVS
jgi:hypothetical protein